MNPPPRLLTRLLPVFAGALVVAFFAAPAPLAGGMPRGGLAETVRSAFVAYWGSGDRDLSPGLRGVVDYWLRFHVVKGLISAMLLVVLGAIAVLAWRAFLRPGATRRAAVAAVGVLATGLALLSLVAVMANIQGAVAPFSSMLPMLTDGPPDAPLASTLAQVRQQLAGPRDAPAAEEMIGDFARYHVAMVVIATIVAVALAGAGVAAWRRFARSARADRRARRFWASSGLLAVLLSLAVALIAVANVTVASDPAPALLAAVQGGW